MTGLPSLDGVTSEVELSDIGILAQRHDREGPRVRRLTAGGRWIRTFGPCREGAGLYCGRRIARGSTGGQKNLAGYRWFESISLQRRVINEPHIAIKTYLSTGIRLAFSPVSTPERKCFFEDLGELDLTQINWVIVGAQSGTHARPMQLDWVRSIRDQCIAAGVAFFFKQDAVRGRKIRLPELDGRQWRQFPE